MINITQMLSVSDIIMAAAMLATALLGFTPARASAASSSDIKTQIDALKAEDETVKSGSKK